jgi:hypothetical protein
MKTLALIASGLLAFSSLPAEARGVVHHSHPHVSIGVGFGAPVYYPFGYDPWFYPYGFYPYDWYAPPPSRAYTDAPTKLYTYPSGGQSDEQMAKDQSECHDWAADQSGFDPATAKKAKRDQQFNYNRAFTACMAARDYEVR